MQLKKKWKDWNKNANHPDVKIRHRFGLQQPLHLG